MKQIIIKYKSLLDLLMSVDELRHINKTEISKEGETYYIYYCYVSSNGYFGIKYALDKKNYSGWISFRDNKIHCSSKPSTTSIRICEVEYNSLLKEIGGTIIL